MHWAASPLSAALRGVCEGLLDLLPPRLRQLWFPPVRCLWLRVEAETLHVAEAVGRERHALGALPWAAGEGAQALANSLDRRAVDGEVWALLPPGQALVRTLSLPLAAEAQLDAVLGHEIDRQTPFSVEQVVFTAQVIERQPAEGQLRAELVVVPKATLDAALSVLGPLAARLSGLDIDDAAHRAGRRRNLLPAALRMRRTDRDIRVRLLLLGVATTALLLAGLVSLGARERALAALEVQRDAAFDTARQARALRQQLDAAASAADFLAEQRHARPTMLELVHDLTRRLPDGVYVQRLAVEQQRVTLAGAARSAGTIVSMLQGSPYLKGPALAGIVQQDRSTGWDGFTVVAELTPGGHDAAEP